MGKKKKLHKPDTQVHGPLEGTYVTLPSFMLSEPKLNPILSSPLTSGDPWKDEMERVLCRIGDSITDLHNYDHDFRERVDIFMRMTLIALDNIQLSLTGISTVKMTAFDPPLHHIPEQVLPRFVPPGQEQEFSMDEFDEEYGNK